MKTKFNLIIFLIFCIGFASCTSQLNAGNNNSGTTTMPEEINSFTSTITPEPQATHTLQPTNTSTFTPTNVPIDIKYQGTALPASDIPITLDNVSQLQKVAQWGRGQISAVAFSPDGSQFVVSSDLGYAVYSMDDLQAPYVWVPFNSPIAHNAITFSMDGLVIKLNHANDDPSVIIEYFNGETLDNQFEGTWAEQLAPTLSPGPGGLKLVSPDQTLKFVTSTSYDQENMNIEYSIRKIFNNQTNELLYELSDETLYYEPSISSYNSGGCDVKFVADCGTPFSPDAYFPYLSAFSPDNQFLFVLYKNSNSFYWDTSGILQVYDANTGKLKSIFENQQPIIKTFAFSPDSSMLVVGLYDGTVGLWDITNSEYIQKTSDFTNSIRYAELANNGESLLLQKTNNLEVRSTTDGSIQAIYDIRDFLLAPDDDRIIYFPGDQFTIKAMDIENGNVVLSIPAHSKSILEFQISPDGEYLATSSTDCSVNLWNAKNGKYLFSLEETIVDSRWGGAPIEEDEFQSNSRILINNIEFIPEKNQIFGYGSWNVAVNWNFVTGKSNYVLYNITEEREEGTDSVSFYYSSIYHIDEINNTVSIFQATYDLTTGEYLGHYESDDRENLACKIESIKRTNANLLLAIGKEENLHKLCVLDKETNQIINNLALYDQYENPPYIDDFWITTDETRLIILTSDDVIDVFEVGK